MPSRYTVIIPVPEYRRDWPALVSLRAAVLPEAGVEIIVVSGAQPAAQRNLALEKAEGEIVVFLDSDSSLRGNYFRILDEAFSQGQSEIVGGPSLLPETAPTMERIFHALLTHPLVVGPVSARYAPRGKFRPATQAQLILCNLAVRREVFARIGPLSTELYPNEENEWLGRAERAGLGIFYQPALQVERPQRESLGALLLTMVRYGMGRTCQCVVSGGRFTVFQLLPLPLLLLALALAFHLISWFWVMMTWAAVAIGIAVTLPRTAPLLPGHRLIAGCLAPLIPLSYALGQCLGWFVAFLPSQKARVPMVLWNQSGQRL